MKIKTMFAVIALSSASMCFSSSAFATSDNQIAGTYTFKVCANAIEGVAILSNDGAVSIVDSNESVIDTAALGVWERDGKNVRGKAIFYRGGFPVELTITNASYDKNTGKLQGTLNLPTGSCPDLVMTPYTF